jgi:hypothetical protein
MEIGSNDGILLKSLLGRNVRILGVDPARNVAEVARQRGVPTVAEFFNEGTRRRQLRRRSSTSRRDARATAW